MTEIEEWNDGSETYSRRSRRGGKRRHHSPRTNQLNEEFRESLPPTRILPALWWSAVLSLLSVANPLLTGLSSNLQSQNLYAGFAMAAGQSPYDDFFGTSGVLFYLLTLVSYLLKSSIGLAVFQFIALFIAGIYFHKIMAYFSRSRENADQLTVWFYLFILAAGFGGVYASIFALPFLLTSIWFLVRYFENGVRDEMFIFYGIDAALVFMIYPKSILLWVVATLVLLVFNGRRGHFARGIYQSLATLFGFLIVIYSVGYYTFVEQILGMAIQQTFFYNIGLHFTNDKILWTLAIIGGALLVSGFLKNFIMTLASFRDKQHSYIKSTLILAFLAELVILIGNPNFDASQLIILLPYGFAMAVMPLKQKSPEEGEGEIWTPEAFDYLKASFFLPLIICLFIPLRPVLTYVLDGNLHQERTEVATYIQEHSEADTKIYAWDNSAYIYLRSQRLSAGNILTAEPYLNSEDNQAQITYDLNKNEAQFIVVNRKIALLDGVQNNLEKSYEALDVGTSNLLLYQKK